MRTAGLAQTLVLLAAAACATSPSATTTTTQEFEDPITHVAIDLPVTWVSRNDVAGVRATLQSYPADKYIGGEAFQPGDTKCDFVIFPAGNEATDVERDRLRNDPGTEIISEETFALAAGGSGTIFHIRQGTMPEAAVAIAEVGGRVVWLACYGSLAPLEGLAASLRQTR